MDIEIHGSVKEIGVSRPKEFGKKVINLKDCTVIKIYPRGIEYIDEFMDIEITHRLVKGKIKGNRIRTIYKLRGGRPFNIKPEVSNSIHIETRGFGDD